MPAQLCWHKGRWDRKGGGWVDQTKGGAGWGVGRGVWEEIGPEEERLDIRRGESRFRKNQCDSMTPLSVVSVPQCWWDGARDPIRTKGPHVTQHELKMREPAPLSDAYFTNLPYVWFEHDFCLTGQMEPYIQTLTTQSPSSSKVCRDSANSYVVHCDDVIWNESSQWLMNCLQNIFRNSQGWTEN